MKQNLRIFMMLLMIILFGGASYGQETATLKFTKACGGKGTDDKGGAWVISSDASEVSTPFDTSKGVHYGSGSKIVSYLNANTSSFSDKLISKIIVNACGASGKASVNCKVGGNSFGASHVITTSNAAYTFAGEASGNIEISLTQTSAKKALYLLSIEVTYIDASSTKTKTTLSFGEENDNKEFSLNVGDAFSAPTATLTPAEAGSIKYSSDNTNVAQVDETTGAVTLGKTAGTAKIAASYEGNDTYAASSASYTIKLAKKIVLEDGVFDFTGDGTVDYGSGLKPKSSTGYGNNYDKSIKWIAGNVILNVEKGTRWITGNPNVLRVFSSQNAKFSISVPSDCVITSINFVGLNGGLSANCGTFSSKTWNGVSQTVVFTATAKKDIQSITVKYVKLESLTTAASSFATYTASYPVNYSECGLTAYAIDLDEANETVKYNEYTGVVPAGKAVLVKGEASKEYTLTPATEAAGDFNTSLIASDGNVQSDGVLYYAFGTVGGKSGFKLVANGVEIPAKKGYLKLTEGTNAKAFFAFEGSTTGIGSIETVAEKSDAPMYNLAGQRVDQNYKGVVVKKGKKFVNK